jgi:asparagine synthetase B (glutamine-hydrolysing)
MSCLRVVKELDRNFAWDGAALYRERDFAPEAPIPEYLRGAAAAVVPTPDDGSDRQRWRIVRDPLGLNKLFWATRDDGSIEVSARPAELVRRGHPFNEINGFPRGCVVDLDPLAPEPVEHSLLPRTWSARSEGSEDLDATAETIRGTLERYLAALAAAYPAAPVYVCLSGGLDSSGVAALAREHFPQSVGVSFDLEREGGPSDDRSTARRLARELRLPLLEANVTEDELLAHIDTVLIEGVDWRDFNVHAGLVNAGLASAIVDATRPRPSDGVVIVLTGDLANELMVDYAPERYRGSTYYELPRLSPAALRSALVRGLDSCHREIGVFGAWGLSVVQPYAVAVDAYLAMPAPFLELPDRKERLCRAIFGSRIPEYVYTRPKARAQVGGVDLGGGVLAACIDHGIDGAWLKRRFADLHRVTELDELDGFVRAGRYRSALPAISSVGVARG